MSSDSVPLGWVTATLADDVELISGQHIPSSECSNDADGTPYLTGPTDFLNGKVVVSKYTKTPKVMCAQGDILLTVKGSGTGKLARADLPYCISRQLMALRPRSWDRDFLFQVLVASQLRFENEASGLIPGLSREQILSTPVDLPPLSEQRKIAAILSSADDTIEKTQAVIDQLEVVKKGLLGELLTRGMPGRHSQFVQTEWGMFPSAWTWTRLGDISSFITSGSRGWAAYYSESGSLFIRSQNIRKGQLDLSDRICVQPPDGAEGERTRVKHGDLLITITGNSVGNVAFVPEGLGHAYVSQHVGLVRLNDPSLHRFTCLFFSAGAPGNAQLIAAQYGQSKPGLSLDGLRKLQVPIPQSDERDCLVEGLTALDERLAAELNKLEGLRAVRTGLLECLLSGVIRVSRLAQEAA